MISNGYILGFSDDLLLIHSSDDFKIDGYEIFPVTQITKIRFNKSDVYFDKIMKWEKEFYKIGITYQVDLTSWKTAFQSIKKQSLNVIVECEQREVDSFNIDPIEKIGSKQVKIRFFDAEG